MTSTGRELKIVAVGDGYVGKTSLLITHTTGKFCNDYVPTVFENYAGTLQVEGARYNYTLWDTAGQEEFDTIRVLCYNQTNVFLVCFAVNSPTSLENVKMKWIPEIRKQCGEVPIVLVGTKADLRSSPQEELVKKAEARKVARTLKLYNYLECSALRVMGCDEVFQEAIRAVVSPQEDWKLCPLL